MAGRRRYKSAYRMTARRKTALRKAQLVSARKRRGKGAAVKVGILAAGIGVGVLGTKYGSSGVNMAKDLKNRGFRFNNPVNAVKVTPAGKEANMVQNAASPASAARQAAPVNPPNMNNTSTPAPSRNRGPAAKGVPGFGGALKNPVNVQNLPQAESIIDPTPPVKTPFPAEHMPSKQEVLNRLKKTDASTVTREDAMLISKLWAAEKLDVAGVRVKGQRRTKNLGYIGVYTGILDYFNLETKKAEQDRLKAKS